MVLFLWHPDSGSDLEEPVLPPLMRSVLPVLEGLKLEGDGEYLDDLVARIDVSSINDLKIMFSNQPPSLAAFTHLPQLIGRVENFRTFDNARIEFWREAMCVTLSPQKWTSDSRPATLELEFVCRPANGPLTSPVEACNTSLLPLSKYNVENVDISVVHSTQDPQSGFYPDDLLWLEVLRRFSAAKRLSLESVGVVPPVAFALKRGHRGRNS